LKNPQDQKSRLRRTHKIFVIRRFEKKSPTSRKIQITPFKSNEEFDKNQKPKFWGVTHVSG
jgi:hypothetical protein